MPTAKKLGRAPQAEIKITEAAICEGTEHSSSHCMIAEAIRASVPHAKYISVDLQTIRFSNMEKGERYTYLTPRAAQIALVDFDQGTIPKPFNVMLRNGQITATGNAYNVTRRAKTKEKIRAVMRSPKGGSGQRQSIPERVGGKPPPLAAGRRRAFGLRALHY